MLKPAAVAAFILAGSLFGVVASAQASQRPAVAAIQVALKARKLYPGPVDGVRGPLTMHAIRAFQRRHGLAVDGIVGSQTRDALGSYAEHQLGERLLRVGALGWDVSELQFLLTQTRLRLTIDGRFGLATEHAVRRFQRRRGLLADGIVGHATISALIDRKEQSWANPLPSGTKISSVPVGGLTLKEARSALLASFYRPLPLLFRGRRLYVAPLALGAQPLAWQAVHAAASNRRNSRHTMRVRISRTRVQAFVGDLQRMLGRRPRGARLLGLRGLHPRFSRPRTGLRVLTRGVTLQIEGELLRNVRRSIRLGAKTTRALRAGPPAQPIVVVERGAHRLVFYVGRTRISEFRIATGRRSAPTPLSRFRIVIKLRRPWWYPPPPASPVPPGPGNPLGTRWMGLSARGIGI